MPGPVAMRLERLLYAAVVQLVLSGCSSGEQSAAGPVPCTTSWNEYVESMLATGDGMGHGPDIGSDEWKSVIEFKLGIRGNGDIPDRSSAAWCTFIDAQIRE